MRFKNSAKPIIVIHEDKLDQINLLGIPSVKNGVQHRAFLTVVVSLQALTFVRFWPLFALPAARQVGSFRQRAMGASAGGHRYLRCPQIWRETASRFCLLRLQVDWLLTCSFQLRIQRRKL